MNESRQFPLDQGEYKDVGLAVFEAISRCPSLPEGTHLDYQSLDEIGNIGFFTVPGGKYIKKYVTGGFLAQLPFQICYKTTPSANYQYFEAGNVIDSIADYLQDQYPLLTGGRRTIEIEMDSTAFISDVQPDGSKVIVRDGRIMYEKQYCD